MSILTYQVKNLAAAAVAAVLLGACSVTKTNMAEVESARTRLTQLQNNQSLAKHAPMAVKNAELAVNAVESQKEKDEQSDHLLYMAERKIDIAIALANSRQLEHERLAMSKERDDARLTSRTNEVNQAKAEVKSAQREAGMARNQAQLAQNSADYARRSALSAEQQNAELKQELKELNAKDTDRGMVVTLGDVLFEFGKAELKGSSLNNLGKLASFLNRYPDREVTIEGHTDSTGSEIFNLGLSERRAESVETYLHNNGIAATRLNSIGLGETAPISSNDSNTGRQQNRRVEVIITAPVVALN